MVNVSGRELQESILYTEQMEPNGCLYCRWFCIKAFRRQWPLSLDQERAVAMVPSVETFAHLGSFG